MIPTCDLPVFSWTRSSFRANKAGAYIYRGTAASTLSVCDVFPVPRRVDFQWIFVKNAGSGSGVLTIASQTGQSFFGPSSAANVVLQPGDFAILVPFGDGTNPLWAVYGGPQKAATIATPSDPTGTTSATAVMMGLAGTLTPLNGARAHLAAMGQMANSLLNDGVTVQLRYGTGTAPTNGAAVTGTQLGAAQTVTSLVAAQRSGFNIGGVATGLTPGTAYWFDLAVLSVTAGTASVFGVTMDAFEV